MQSNPGPKLAVVAGTMTSTRSLTKGDNSSVNGG
jgi:hypothetical protein